MKSYEHSGWLFISLNPSEHVAITLPGSMLDDLYQSGKTTEDMFLFFANDKGSLLKIGDREYELLRKFSPKSPFDEQLKQLVSEFFLAKEA